MKLAAWCVLGSALWVTNVEAKQDAAPDNTGDAPAVAATHVLESPPPIQAPELPPESGMYSVGMFAGGIALIVGGVVNSVIGIGLFAALSSQGGNGGAGALALVIGGPLLFDGTVQISIGIPMIVVGGADAESEPEQVEQVAQRTPVATRNGLTLAVPF